MKPATRIALAGILLALAAIGAIAGILDTIEDPKPEPAPVTVFVPTTTTTTSPAGAAIDQAIKTAPCANAVGWATINAAGQVITAGADCPP